MKVLKIEYLQYTKALSNLLKHLKYNKIQHKIQH